MQITQLNELIYIYQEITHEKWVRTIFEVSIVGYGQVTMRVNISANNYGVWETDWAFA